MKPPTKTEIDQAGYNYSVNWTIIEKGEEKRKVKRFKEEAKAAAWLARKEALHSSLGKSLSDITLKEERALLAWRCGQQDLVGVEFPSLEKVVSREIERLTLMQNSVTLANICNACVDQKINKGRSERTWKEARDYLNHFRKHFGDDRSLVMITSDEIQDYLDHHVFEVLTDDKGVKTQRKLTATTINCYKGAIRNLYNFAKTKRFVRYNPIDDVVTLDNEDVKTEILTLPEMVAVLEIATGSVKLAFLLQAFCGLRTSEVCLLLREDINLLTRIISVPNEAKTGNRMVEICKSCIPQLTELLKDYGDSDALWEHRADYLPKKMTKVYKAAGVSRRNNVLRHSFCTYHLAKFQNWAKTEYQAGNSKDVLRDNYKGKADKREGKKWFKLPLQQ